MDDTDNRKDTATRRVSARKLRILFCSRGRGYGHAMPDMAIADEVMRACNNVEVLFASYASGAFAFRRAGRACYDLRLPECNSVIETIIKCNKLFETIKPDLVVAHEEFAAIASAEMSNITSAFISAWLPPSGTVMADCLRFAKAIIVLGEPGIFAVPKNVHVKPIYAGHITRVVSYTVNDRLRLRSEFGWSEDMFCVLVVPGGASSESDSPMTDLVYAAFVRLNRSNKRLIWISENDYEHVAAKFNDDSKVEARRFSHPIERWLAAADLVITKGSRGITIDAATVGVPSLSVSFGNNRIDEMLVPRIKNNIALVAQAVDAEILVRYINQTRPVNTVEFGIGRGISGKTAVQVVADKLLDLLQLGPMHALSMNVDVLQLPLPREV